MSELRRNPLTGEWVIPGEEVARTNSSAPSEGEAPSYSKDCPFCPGNEASTPPAVLEVPDPQAGRWLIRVFPNKYPALTPSPPTRAGTASSLFVVLPGEGHHEVIVETPVHNRFPADRSVEELAALLTTYQERCRASSIRHVLIFKNRGLRAVTSLEHPHSQVIAAPIVPESVRRRWEIAAEHHRSTGRCLLCDVAAEEISDGRRIVHFNECFVVFHPFVAARPGET